MENEKQNRGEKVSSPRKLLSSSAVLKIFLKY